MASAEAERQLRFRWDDHMQHISKVLTVQRLEERFCDATLVTEDGFVMKAHQAILASTSSYFRRILQDVTSDQHPMIVLRGAKFREMTCLLDYMYQGNTQVDQSLMESVLEVADMLEVKGLSRIRTNTSLKRFMGPGLPPQDTPQDQEPLRPSCQEEARRKEEQREETRRKDEQREDAQRQEEQARREEEQREEMYHGLQEGRSEEAEVWRRAGGGGVEGVTREAVLATDQLPTHTPTPTHTPAHTHSIHVPPNLQPPDHLDQTSGIDLSLAKNEPWSPRHTASSHDADDSSPAKKKRKRQENMCSEVTLDPVADPDWGRIGTKLDERVVHKPRSNCLPSASLSDMDGSTTSPAAPEPPSVEVSCADGPLTISLTTGLESDAWRSLVRRRPLFCTSLSLRRVKRKIRTRRSLDESRKRWLAKERRSLFGLAAEVGGERPVTRALERLKASTEVSVNCDLPFPKVSGDKENIASPNTSAEDNPKGPSPTKSTPSSAKEPNMWELTERRPGDGKYQEPSDEVKFPTISPLSLFTLPPVKEREKQTRTTLTLEEKVKVIEAFLDGKSQRQIAHLYGIGKTQVSGIIKRREEILTIYRDSLLRGEKLTMKRQRKSEYALLNQHLIQWYKHMTVAAGVKITTGMLRAKALQIAPELGYHDFKASNGWLATFKANNNLKFSKQRKPNDADQANEANENDSSHPREDDDAFFDDGEEMSPSHAPLTKHLASITQNITTTTTITSADTATPDVVINRTTSTLDSASTNTSDPSTSLLHPSLNKTPQMVNTLGAAANLTAAYNLSRDLTRDLTPNDLSSMNPSPLNHPLNHPLKPSDALSSYKSEEPIGYGYDQNRMTDATTTRSTEYNYAPYGFPGGYYGYHFLGQY